MSMDHAWGSMGCSAGCVGGKGRASGGERGAWVVGVGQAGGHALGPGRALDGVGGRGNGSSLTPPP